MGEKFDVNKISCDKCKYEEECEKHNGKKRDDGDDYRAIIGSHMCQLSWEGFGR